MRRLCTSLPPCLAAAAVTVLVLVPVAPAAAARADTPPACAGADAHAFPVAARIRGGPGSYEAGGGYGTWYIDLTNTTRRTCTGIHPVIVLVDDKRALRPDQPRLDFFDGPKARPVKFEGTDEQELVGVLDGAGFDGFAVPPGRTVSVRVRLALPSDAAPDRVIANAAVVQRRGADGEWVGESNAYRFGIGQDAGDATPDPQGTRDGGGVAPSSSGSPQATPSASAGTGTGTAAPSSAPDSSRPPFAEAGAEAAKGAAELARTGPGLAQVLLAATLALVAVGASALLLSRGRR
ncbi:hypothetical protein AB0L75_27520 [Streptomyces sp. NPDC052101]|uniref:hypothetical protein n=1 Tax=Streptomyces sp. NPDC052101 TaxID=3155763 RepID=UPI00341A53AB